MNRDHVRKAGVAGSFYPANKMELERDLSLLLENSPIVEISQSLKAIIVPHAGYMYSGGVAARAYRQVFAYNYEFAVILATSHHESFDFVSIYPGKSFATPLGEIPIEKSVVDSLVSQNSIFQLSESGYSSEEHSLEVQLPLLKWVQDSPMVVPMMLAQQDRQMIDSVSQVLAETLRGKNCLLIASTDLSHSHPDSVARNMDNIVITHINNYKPDHLYQDIMDKRCEMCGYGPAIIAMKVAKEWGATNGKVLLYRNSGDMTGEMNNVVGYLSAMLY